MNAVVSVRRALLLGALLVLSGVGSAAQAGLRAI
jgi:hypothetical protein